MMKRSSPIAAFLLLLTVAGTLPARAQSVGLAPSQIVESFKPGVPFEYELNVQNYGSTPVKLSVQITDLWYAEKAVPDEKTGLLTHPKTFNTPGTSPRSAANWIQFVPETFELEPGHTQKMKAIITPPATANDGGYYATLFVVSQPVLTNKVTKQGGAVFTNMRLGTLVLLAAKDTEKYDVRVGEVKVTPPTASKDMHLQVALDNQSNVHVFPRVRVAVLDSNRKLVGKAEGDQKRLLPGQQETLEVTWSGKPAPGAYTAVVTVSYGETHIDTKTVPFEVKP